jgi:hypothetical protein
MGKNQDPDKHPGSATLILSIKLTAIHLGQQTDSGNFSRQTAEDFCGWTSQGDGQ